MTHHRPKLSVQELVGLLERPKRKSTHKVKEPVVDREEVRKHMRLKWKGNLYMRQTPTTAAQNSQRLRS
jgi:hypothetical protein